jgi:toxin ParE1/3/4
MPAIYVSSKAEADIDSIIEYTKKSWGQRQADDYLTKIENSFKLLARNPLIGRSCEAISPGLHRYEVGKHVLFYASALDGVMIIRVLHQRMVPARARFEE